MAESFACGPMMPEAFEHGGKLVRLETTPGFALASTISALERPALLSRTLVTSLGRRKAGASPRFRECPRQESNLEPSD